jgi:S-DNA-T family DNA segregation ATPase FtsK/SpoIIIE
MEIEHLFYFHHVLCGGCAMPKKIRPYLEYQADRVEAVLAAHRAPGRITGGTVGPRIIRFFLNPAPHTRFSAIRRLADDIALAMRVPNLAVDRDENGVVLAFANPNPNPVDLLPLLEDARPVPNATAVLGLTDDGVPLLARLSAPEVAHVLVAGTTGSGKSVLLRTMATSLVLTHHPHALRLLAIDPKGRTFRPLAGVPHLTRPIITEPAEALEALRSLLRTMEIRDQRGDLPGDPQNQGRSGVPRIVVFIDEMADLMMAGGKDVTEALTRLAQRGREAGIHLVAATQHPSAAILGSVMRANFPLRLVGRVVAAQDARVAAGRGGTDAHLLHGRGDFLAVSGGAHPIRFQVAHVTEDEIHDAVIGMTRRQQMLPAPNATRKT